jgi:hypothetical protein
VLKRPERVVGAYRVVRYNDKPRHHSAIIPPMLLMLLQLLAIKTEARAFSCHQPHREFLERLRYAD